MPLTKLQEEGLKIVKQRHFLGEPYTKGSPKPITYIP